MIPNQQCLYLARKQHDKRMNLEYPVTALECDAVYSLLLADLDWVGLTETMQETTLPLLSFMLTGDPATGRSFQRSNSMGNKKKLVHVPLQVSELNADT